MRLLLALALLGAVVGKEETCPIIKWLEEHGEDIFETVMACKNVPAALKAARDSECHSKPSARDKVAMGIWFAMLEMQHLNGTLPNIVKHSKIAEMINDIATLQLIASTHKKMDNFCSHPECSNQGKTLSSVIAPCYGSLICSFMTKFVPFAPCKDASEKYLDNVVSSRIGSACGSEVAPGATHKYYCMEMQADLMYRDIECLIEYKSGGVRGCTPKCVSQWQGMSSKLPMCTKEFVATTEQSYELLRSMMQDLAKAATDPNFKKAIERMPKSSSSYDDVCNKKSAVGLITV